MQYCIEWPASHSETRRRRTFELKEFKWKTQDFNKDIFVEALRTNSGANLDAEELTKAIAMAWDESMPKKLELKCRRRPAYW